MESKPVTIIIDGITKKYDFATIEIDNKEIIELGKYEKAWKKLKEVVSDLNCRADIAGIVQNAMKQVEKRYDILDMDGETIGEKRKRLGVK